MLCIFGYAFGIGIRRKFKVLVGFILVALRGVSLLVVLIVDLNLLIGFYL